MGLQQSPSEPEEKGEKGRLHVRETEDTVEGCRPGAYCRVWCKVSVGKLKGLPWKATQSVLQGKGKNELL